MEVEVGQICKHFKGNYYAIEDIANDSETNKEMVIYRAMYLTDGEFKLWVRPLSMFTEMVERRELTIPRFKLFEITRLTDTIKEIIFNERDIPEGDGCRLGIDMMMEQPENSTYVDLLKILNPTYVPPEKLKYSVLSESDKDIRIIVYPNKKDYIQEILNLIKDKETAIIEEEDQINIIYRLYDLVKSKYVLGFNANNRRYLYISDASTLPDLISIKDDKKYIYFFEFIKNIINTNIDAGCNINGFHIPEFRTEEIFYKKLYAWFKDLGHCYYNEKEGKIEKNIIRR